MAIKKAIITISALNYSSRVEVLRNSLKEHSPGIPFFHFIMDDVDGLTSSSFLKTTEQCLFLKDLDRFCRQRNPHFSIQNMLFPYDIVEGATAVKPFVLSMMLEQFGFQEILFLDPDIEVYSDLDSIWSKLHNSNVVLTPHLIKLSQYENAILSERSILRSGTYNLGFLGLRKSKETLHFLNWWGRRLVHHCSRDVSEGLFTDQKWIDLIVGAVHRVQILKDPGLNIAHWNIHERLVTRNRQGQYLSNDQTLKFFHFSGFEIKTSHLLTKHLPHLPLNSLGVVEDLVKAYARKLKRSHSARFEEIPYGLNSFSNKVQIPQILKDWVRRGGNISAFSDVYDVSAKDSFFNWLFKPRGLSLCLFAEIVRLMTEDLQRKFPDKTLTSNINFMVWLVQHGSSELQLDSRITRILKRLLLDLQNAART